MDQQPGVGPISPNLWLQLAQETRHLTLEIQEHLMVRGFLVDFLGLRETRSHDI